MFSLFRKKPKGPDKAFDRHGKEIRRPAVVYGMIGDRNRYAVAAEVIGPNRLVVDYYIETIPCKAEATLAAHARTSSLGLERIDKSRYAKNLSTLEAEYIRWMLQLHGDA